VDQFAGAQDAASQRGRVERLREGADEAPLELGVAPECRKLHRVAAQQEHRRELGPEKPQHVGDDGVEYRLGIVCRAAKRFEDLGGCGLLLDRLSELPLCLGELAGSPVELLLQVG